MSQPRFLDQLHKLDIGWPNIMLMSELRFIDRDDRLWTVPEGFVCDLASVPWFGRWLVPRAGRHNRAAVLHDWLFYLRSQGELKLTRNQADGLMMQAMRADGVRPTRRALIRSALFVGSWVPWHFGKETKQELRK